ncbi:hypothetical protein GLYMA_12G090650v4 [Glycine max]|nr:hypothetical protein GYH30_033155 [Glycine max]KRH25255.2 hypothetical protein GLYMA_12G090650v4 [Glycine max]
MFFLHCMCCCCFFFRLIQNTNETPLIQLFPSRFLIKGKMKTGTMMIRGLRRRPLESEKLPLRAAQDNRDRKRPVKPRLMIN